MGKEDSKKSEKKEKVEKAPKLELPEEPEKPDKKKLEDETSAIEKKIAELKKEQQGFTEQIDARQVGKPEYEEKRAALQQDFEKAKDLFDEKRSKLYELTNQVKQNRETTMNSKKELRSLERGIDALDEAGIDKKIREVEMRMHTTSMSLSQEKAAMKEIAELKKKRPEVQRMAQKLAALKNDAANADKGSAPLEEQIQAIKKEMDLLKKEKDEKKDLVNKLQDEHKEKNKGIKQIIEQRDAVRSKVKEQQDKKWEIKKQFDKIQKVHWDWQREVRNIKKKVAEEREKKEWEQWEAENKKKELEKAAEKPYFEEMTLLEQTIDYCKSILKEEGLLKEDKKEEEVKKDASADAPEGAMVMLSKKDRDAEMYIDPSAKGKKLKKKNQGGDAKKKNIKHNAGTFALFTKLKVSAPMTVDDVPSTLEKLEAEMEVFNGKIREWEEKRKEAEKELKEAESKANATPNDAE